MKFLGNADNRDNYSAMGHSMHLSFLSVLLKINYWTRSWTSMILGVPFQCSIFYDSLCGCYKYQRLNYKANPAAFIPASHSLALLLHAVVDEGPIYHYKSNCTKTFLRGNTQSIQDLKRKRGKELKEEKFFKNKHTNIGILHLIS